ncbi:MAG: hypothetical protein ACLFTV_02885 [Desulfococcaceae bacterium]
MTARFILAEEKHDGQLRRIVRETPIPGHISVAYEREPRFFDALEISSRRYQVVAGAENGRVLGMGCRSVDEYRVNGAVREFGYLGGLRSLVRGSRVTGLARGYRFFRKLHDADPVPGYLTTIIDDNDHALRLLTSGRGGLPTYADFGEYRTAMIFLNRYRRFSRRDAVEIRPGSEVAPSEITRFWAEEGGRRQFFPHREAERFDRFRGCKRDDLFVALRDGRIAGTALLWDQGFCKQHRIVGYGRGMAGRLPAINLGLRAAGFSGLPGVGEEVRYAYLSMVCVREDDPAVFRRLIDAAYIEARRRGLGFLCIGFHADDPLAVALRKYPRITYRSRLFVVDWRPEADIRAEFGGRIPYLEPAML